MTAFVEWLWVQPGWRKGTYTAPSTIDRRLSGVVVTGRTDHGLVPDKTVAARARRVLKVKVKEMEKTKETRGRGPAPALLAEHLRATVVAAPDNRLGIRDRSIGLTCFAIAGREHEVAFLRARPAGCFAVLVGADEPWLTACRPPCPWPCERRVLRVRVRQGRRGRC
ncbi:hypothetical protein [Streptomyces bobili]